MTRVPTELFSHRLNHGFIGIPDVSLTGQLERIERLKSRKQELIDRTPDGEYYATPTADAWGKIANAYAEELGEPHPEFRFMPKGSKPVEELWAVANQIEQDREKLEAQIGEYAYALRAAVAWGNLREALRRN